MRKERQLNIELLRILSMFLITLWHIQCHFVYPANLGQSVTSQFLAYSSYFIPFHVDLFVLITGYFGIKDNKARLVKTVLLLAFYSIALNAISALFFEGGSLIDALLPISHSSWWFMQIYILLLIFAPVLEVYMERSNPRSFYTLLFSVIFVNVYLGFLMQVPSIDNKGYDIINFVCVYLIGVFLRKEGKDRFMSLRYPITYSFICMILLAMAQYKAISLQETFNVSITDYNSPYCILMAILIFLLSFKVKIHARKRKSIMFLSSSAVAVYLITDHPIVRKLLFQPFCDIYKECQNSSIGILYIFFSITVLYVICCCIDKLRIHTTELLIRKFRI